MTELGEVGSHFALLRQSVQPGVAEAIEALVQDPVDRRLNRINALSFADTHGLRADDAIAGFLHATRLGLFELSWNVLCPGCGGVLGANASLRGIERDSYHCSLCAAAYEPTLDEIIEVTFTVSPRVRRIAAHEPERLPFIEYFRQMFWASGVDLPDDLDAVFEEVTLEAVELPPGERAILALQLPAEFILIFDPVTHATTMIDVQGEPTRERQQLTLVLDDLMQSNAKVAMRPGPLRLVIENHTDKRVLPGAWIANDTLHELLARRRPFLTAKRLLSHQTFRDLYRTETLGADQRLKITSLTFLFTDLRGSTALYDRVGDLAAFDLVREHFGVLNAIVAEESGAVVKTIGDAVMATFPTPERGMAAALRMREAMRGFNDSHGRDDLLLKIGIHAGPCLAVTLNDRQDYFGQTVNIASRVQDLATSQAIFATGLVVDTPAAREILEASGAMPRPHRQTLRGIADELTLYEIP